jgi:hypothetical protein
LNSDDEAWSSKIKGAGGEFDSITDVTHCGPLKLKMTGFATIGEALCVTPVNKKTQI